MKNVFRADHETPRAAGRLQRSIGHLVAASLAAVIWLGAQPAFAQSSTTVSPAATRFDATSTDASFSLGGVSVNCAETTTTATVPAEPDNQNRSGPVCAPIAAPVFTNCRTSVGTPATVTTSGAWQHCVQFDPDGSAASLTIPQGGVVITTAVSGVRCTIVAAPSGPGMIRGTWSNASQTTPPMLTFSNVSVPVRTSGDPCPPGTTASHSVSFAVSPDITVGP